MTGPSVRLRVEAGPLVGTELVWERHDVAVLGRASDCRPQLPATDTDTSRHHAVLEVNPPDARLRDLGSRNGTWINGVRYGGRAADETPDDGARRRHPDVPLRDGDVIEVGGHRFTFSVDGGGPSPGTSSLEPRVDGSIGATVGGHVLERRLGAGGSGVVYQARPGGGGPPVALKVLTTDVRAGEVVRSRFLREAATQLSFSHAHIVPLHDHGRDGDAFWFTMELCDGGSVADLLDRRRGRLTVGEAAPILLDALDGLAAAHRAGIVHRDVKPHNLLLVGRDDRMTAKLADLGLAKCFADAGLSGMTVTGAYAGSWPYMPREQLVDFRSVRPVSDVWSIAATAYVMLTGHLPRDERGYDDPASAVLSAHVVPIRERDVTVPRAVACEIDRALRTDPAGRHRDAAELRTALVAALAAS